MRLFYVKGILSYVNPVINMHAQYARCWCVLPKGNDQRSVMRFFLRFNRHAQDLLSWCEMTTFYSVEAISYVNPLFFVEHSTRKYLVLVYQTTVSRITSRGNGNVFAFRSNAYCPPNYPPHAIDSSSVEMSAAWWSGDFEKKNLCVRSSNTMCLHVSIVVGTYHDDWPLLNPNTFN